MANMWLKQRQLRCDVKVIYVVVPERSHSIPFFNRKKSIVLARELVQRSEGCSDQVKKGRKQGSLGVSR